MEEYVAETWLVGNFRVKLIADTDAESPDNWNGGEELGIVTTRNRYFELQQGGFKSPDEVNPNNKDNKDTLRKYWVFPLYMYVHSGVSLSLGNSEYPFNDRWDAGQVGYVFASKKTWRLSDSARKACQSYVDTWNMYLSGDVWGYVIETLSDDDTDGENVDSCWGFYGLDFARKEAQDAAKYYQDEAIKAEGHL